MSKSSELYALRRSFSGDTQVKAQSRSGDKSESGAMLWDFVASTQSAEYDIIEAQEREEQLEAKRKFAKLLRLYFKKILTASEYSFLAACIRANKSLYVIGKTQGVKYKEVIESITEKCKRNEKEFFLLMTFTGYDCRRGCEFMSQIFNGNKRRRDIRAKLEQLRIKNREYIRNWDRLNIERRREIRARYIKNNPEKIRQERAKYKATHKEKIKEQAAKNYQKHKEERRLYKAKYRETHREQKRAADVRYRERKRQKKLMEQQNEEA